MPTLDPRSAALILVDLQQGIVPLAKGPVTGDVVVANARNLAARFREIGAPVVLTHVAVTPEDQPSRLADRPPFPADGTPPGYSDFVSGLREPSDIVVLKRHWGAFTGTDLDLQLRRHGVTTVVIAGLVTHMGVESTARSAWELSYNVVIAADVCASFSTELHDYSVSTILPMIARVTGAEGVDFDIG